MRRKKYTQKINYSLVGQLLRIHVNENNKWNITETGPYAKVAKSLGKKNLHTAIRHLKTIWWCNRGGVRDVARKDNLNEPSGVVAREDNLNEPSRVVAREDNLNEPSRFVAREDNLNEPSRVVAREDNF